MTDNRDRLLTRVWDKQEKKMYYVGDSLPDNCYSEFVGKYHTNFTLIAINEYGLCVGAYIKDTAAHIQIFNVSFGDRYIPMQCSGFREDYEYVEDGMPVFEFDIIQSHMAELFLIVLKDGCWVANLIRDKKIINRPICDLASLEGRFTIKGNKWENPELLEVKE